MAQTELVVEMAHWARWERKIQVVFAAEAVALKVVLEEFRLAVRMVGEEETEEALVAPMDLLALLEHFRPVP